VAGRARRVPTRSCVACRTAREKRDLDRIVRTPAGTLTLDVTGRLAGRGAYICRDAACREKALDKGVLARALEVPVPAELRTTLAAALSTTSPITDTAQIIGGDIVGQE
jgi:uncharacterized protein